MPALVQLIVAGAVREQRVAVLYPGREEEARINVLRQRHRWGERHRAAANQNCASGRAGPASLSRANSVIVGATHIPSYGSMSCIGVKSTV